jgi:hypothetical protein
MRSVGWFAALAIAIATCAAGCGGSASGAQASCTLWQSTPGASLMFCEEIERASPEEIASMRLSCGLADVDVAGGGTPESAQFVYGPCSRDGAVGGCQTVVGTTVITQWYYDDGTGALTPSGVQMACTTAGGIFVQV